MPKTCVRGAAGACLHRFLPPVSPSQGGFLALGRLVPLEVDVRAPGAPLEGEAETTISLPDAAAGLLLDLLSDLAEGRAVSVSDADEELTTREAAELLNVSRPHLTQLLKEGEIPSHKVGSHHRVYRRDVLAYKARRQEESEEAMQELTRLSQELGSTKD